MASEPKPRRRLTKRDALGDDMLLRVFTLADYAVTPPDGKLYISGGGIDQMLIPAIPGPLGSLYLALRIRLPRHKASKSLGLEVRALNAERVPVGADPLAGANVEVGRGPGQKVGDEIGINAVVPLQGLHISKAGTIYFHVALDGASLGVLPLRVGAMPRGQAPRSGDRPGLDA